MPKANTILEIDPYTYSNEFLTSLYRDLLFPRLIEEKMLLLLRKGKISKWFSGIGQEAISVGATRALQSDEFIFPMHRNLGVFTTREVPLNRLFHQFQGTRNGFTNGRDRSFHFGTLSHHLVGMISHLGPQLALAGGIALAHQLRAEQKVSLAFSGEGGTSEGDFHEALNIAAVWKLPVIFLIENNGYGLSTPVSEQYACEQLSERAQGYGMLGETIDGNDVLQVYHCIQTHAERMRKDPYPVLIECMTFRMRGHEEASGTAYVPEELFTQWQEKDPIARFETSLLERNILSQELIAQIRDELTEQIDGAIEEVYEQEHEFTCSADEEISAVFAPVTTQASEPKEETKEARFVDAVSDGLYQSLKRYPELLILGQDVGTYGGVFKITKDFTEIFGTDRIRNTPLCESGVLGNALGLSIAGMKAVVEMQFSDFVSCGMTQIINYFAKLYYRWGQPADVVVRLPCGAGVGAGPFHSQTMEAWFTHTAGLKVVYPAFPIDAKGLLIRAIEDPNPVMFFEHKKLYRSITGDVPTGYFSTELGKAQVLREGEEFSIITYGLGVHWALEFSQQHDLSCDIVDLRTLIPLDWQTITSSIQKTGRALVLYEAPRTGAFGAEIAARISEECFSYLDAPVMRCASMDTPIPFNSKLEEQYLAKSRLAETVAALQAY